MTEPDEFRKRLPLNEEDPVVVMLPEFNTLKSCTLMKVPSGVAVVPLSRMTSLVVLAPKPAVKVPIALVPSKFTVTVLPAVFKDEVIAVEAAVIVPVPPSSIENAAAGPSDPLTERATD